MDAQQFSPREPDIKRLSAAWIQAPNTLATDSAGLSLRQYPLELDGPELERAVCVAGWHQFVRRLRDGQPIDHGRGGWRNRVCDYPRIVRLIADALPPAPDREECARVVADLIAVATIAVRNGASPLALNRLRRAKQKRLGSPLEPKLCVNSPTPEGEFDRLVSFILGPILSVPARVRLIQRLRDALGMTPAKVGSLRRRLYDQDASIRRQRPP